MVLPIQGTGSVPGRELRSCGCYMAQPKKKKKKGKDNKKKIKAVMTKRALNSTRDSTLPFINSCCVS